MQRVSPFEKLYVKVKILDYDCHPVIRQWLLCTVAQSHTWTISKENRVGPNVSASI